VNMSFSCWFGGIKVPFYIYTSSVSTRYAGDCRSRFFVVEEVDGVSDKGSGDTTTLGGVGTIFLTCRIIRTSGVSASGLKELYRICNC
jgi:hypothetical protein